MSDKPRKSKRVPLVSSVSIEWTRADPAELAKFDPASKVCTMNCGQHGLDPRSRAELKLLCGDCDSVPPARSTEPMPDVSLSEPFARCVLGMMTACYSEGVGPEYYQLRDWIAQEYPHLVTDPEFSWLDWEPPRA